MNRYELDWIWLSLTSFDLGPSGSDWFYCFARTTEPCEELFRGCPYLRIVWARLKEATGIHSVPFFMGIFWVDFTLGGNLFFPFFFLGRRSVDLFPVKRKPFVTLKIQNPPRLLTFCKESLRKISSCILGISREMLLHRRVIRNLVQSRPDIAQTNQTLHTHVLSIWNQVQSNQYHHFAL